MKDNVLKYMIGALVIVGSFQLWNRFKSNRKMHHDVRTNADYESDISSGYGSESDLSELSYVPTPTGEGPNWESESDTPSPIDLGSSSEEQE